MPFFHVYWLEEAAFTELERAAASERYSNLVFERIIGDVYYPGIVQAIERRFGETDFVESHWFVLIGPINRLNFDNWAKNEKIEPKPYYFGMFTQQEAFYWRPPTPV